MCCRKCRTLLRLQILQLRGLLRPQSRQGQPLLFFIPFPLPCRDMDGDACVWAYHLQCLSNVAGGMLTATMYTNPRALAATDRAGARRLDSINSTRVLSPSQPDARCALGFCLLLLLFGCPQGRGSCRCPKQAEFSSQRSCSKQVAVCSFKYSIAAL